MAKLLQHHTNGTFYTTRFEDGVVTRRIHPDGVVLLKRRGVRLGDDIPPFAMVELVASNWLYSEEEASRQGTVNWAPDWETIGHPPARSKDWIRASTGWTRLETANGIVNSIEVRQDGFRSALIGAGLALILVTLITALLM